MKIWVVLPSSHLVLHFLLNLSCLSFFQSFASSTSQSSQTLPFHPFKDVQYLTPTTPFISSPSQQQTGHYGITFLYVLQPRVILPFTQNITISEEKMTIISIKRRPLFTLVAEIPWRKIKLTFHHPNISETYSCDINEMLHANQEYSLIVQLLYDQDLLSIFLYINGILKNSCFHYLTENIFFPRLSSGIFSGYFDRHTQLSLKTDTRPHLIMKINHLLYWNRPLNYLDIQYLSTLSSILIGHQKELIQVDSAHTLTERVQRNWVNRFLPSSQNLSCTTTTTQYGESQICQVSSSVSSDEEVSIVLWPSFYTHAYPSHTLLYLTEQIYESIWNVLHSLPPNASPKIFVPLLTSSNVSDPLYASLIAHFQTLHPIPLTTSHSVDSNQFSSDIFHRLSSVFIVPIQMKSYSHRFFSFAKATTSLMHILYPSLSLSSSTSSRTSTLGTSSVQSLLSIGSIILQETRMQDVDFSISNFLATYPQFRQENLPTPKYLTFISSHIYPRYGWFDALISEAKSYSKDVIVGAKILSSTGKISHFGHELFELPFTGGTEILLVPHDRYRYVILVLFLFILS